MEIFFIVYGVIVTHLLCGYLPDSISLSRRGLFAGVLTSLLAFLGLVFMVNRGFLADIPTFQLLSASVLGAFWGVMLVFLADSYVELIGQSKDTQKTFVFTILSPFQNASLSYAVGGMFLILMIAEILELSWFSKSHEDSGRLVLLLLMGIFFLFFVLKKVWARTALVLMLSLLFYSGVTSIVLQAIDCPLTQTAVVLKAIGVFLLFLPFVMPLRGIPAVALMVMIAACSAYPVYLQLSSTGECTPSTALKASRDDSARKKLGAENRYVMVLPDGFQFITRKDYLKFSSEVPEEADLFFQSLDGSTYGYTEIYEVDPVADAPGMTQTIKDLYTRFRKTYWSDYERLAMLKDSVNAEGFDLHFNYQRASGSGGFLHSFRYGNFVAMSVTIQSSKAFDPTASEGLDEILMGIDLIENPARAMESQEKILGAEGVK